MKKKILLLDMDEVLTNFFSHPTLRVPVDSIDHEYIYRSGYFSMLKPLYGAIDSVKKLIDCGKYDIYICTQPLAGSPSSFSEKAEWIKRYLPALEGKIIMTCNKNLIKGDILIDDSIKWKDFGGRFIHFNHRNSNVTPYNLWYEIVEELI